MQHAVLFVQLRAPKEFSKLSTEGFGSQQTSNIMSHVVYFEGCRSIENGRRGVLNRGNRLYGGRWLAAGHFTNE
ncbi:unnamed protein product [Brugia timori]|uniref:Uncharacterized protein n=2 Tax=Brugia TaxID=6278 RepID=A0A8L7YN41_BRUMA|nr:unnamed protein product [Brugia timori]